MGKNYRIEVDGKRYVVKSESFKSIIDAMLMHMEDYNDYKDIKPVEKKQKNKKHLYTVSSYCPEMGWFREYTGHSKEEAAKEYRRCRKIYKSVIVECDGVNFSGAL